MSSGKAVTPAKLRYANMIRGGGPQSRSARTENHKPGCFRLHQVTLRTQFSVKACSDLAAMLLAA
jgi:hypothetical protein